MNPTTFILSILITVGLNGCLSTPTNLTSEFRWANKISGYDKSIEEDKASCVSAIENIENQPSSCDISEVKDCEQYENRTKRELCITSQSFSSTLCDNENVETKKNQLVGMCITSKGWEQIAIPNY